MHEPANTDVGGRLRAARERRGWSREKLAIATGWTRPPTPSLDEPDGPRQRRTPVGVAPRTIASFEYGLVSPQVATLAALAAALDVTVAELVGEIAA